VKKFLLVERRLWSFDHLKKERLEFSSPLKTSLPVMGSRYARLQLFKKRFHKLRSGFFRRLLLCLSQFLLYHRRAGGTFSAQGSGAGRTPETG
jgi:hypothetical protein